MLRIGRARCASAGRGCYVSSMCKVLADDTHCFPSHQPSAVISDPSAIPSPHHCMDQKHNVLMSTVILKLMENQNYLLLPYLFPV